MPDQIERIKARWTAQKIPIRPGASPEALDAFEVRYGVVLPTALRDYFASVDGMVEDLDHGPWNWDAAFHRFWPLAEFVPVRDFQGVAPSPPWKGRWFVFADHCINCFAFIVKLTSDRSGEGPVAIWDFGEGRSLITPTFHKFLELYLADPWNIIVDGKPIDD